MAIIDRRHALLALVVLGGLLLGAPCQADDPRTLRLAELASRAFEKVAPPGLSVAVMHRGELIYQQGFGQADLENEVGCTPETVYRIASISKPIAAVAVMQCIERGEAALDDPIQKFVPEFPVKPEGVVTLRHLLTHTAGIRHYKPGEFVQRRHYDTLVDAIKIFKDDPLLFAPGERFSYTSYGFNLLAGVVEQTSGQPYGQYLRERIFEPAGMTATRLEEQGELVPHRARQYERHDKLGWRNAPFADLSIKWAGGGVISTVVDLCRFDHALADGKLLRPETIALMQTPGTLSDGRAIDYALGWRIETDKQGGTFVSHSGGTTGGTSFLLRVPEQQVAVALIANAADVNGLPQLARSLARAATAEAKSE